MLYMDIFNAVGSSSYSLNLRKNRSIKNAENFCVLVVRNVEITSSNNHEVLCIDQGW